ncbi:MAG: M91 family zinc metallopeptidase [Pyrinomonadaceae bacterium]
MGRIEDGQIRVQHHQNQPPPVVKPKKEELPKPLIVAQNANTQRGNVQSYGDQQKARLNNLLNGDRRDNSLLIGGTAGSTAAQFELSEQSVRNVGVIKIKGDASTPADFVSKVERDIQKLAPNYSLELRPQNSPYYEQLWDKMYGSDTLAVVRRPENTLQPRVGGHEQGYRLLDQLHNNPNEITISYKANDAFAAPRNYLDSFGTVTSPNKGSAVDVHYDPDLSVGLPVKKSNGSLTNALSDSAIVLGHEFGHASHMQRGTQQNVDGTLLQNFGANQNRIMGTQGKENIFSSDGRFYQEGDHLQIGLREEFRNVGMPGHRYGSEPTENSLRRELGITDRRVSYQDQASYTEITPTQARLGQLSTRTQTFRDNVVDGVRGSRNSALIGGGMGAVTALWQGKDAKGVVEDTALGAGTGVAQEVIQKTVNGARATTVGMSENAFRTAASQVKGAAVAGAVINTAFAVHDQWDNLQNDATRSTAVGVVASEAVVGAASGAAGAYAGAMAGAAIGSIVPGVGTVIGGIVGFAVGAGVGYLTDKGLRGLGVDKMIATGVTATIDTVSNLGHQAGEAISNVANNVAEGAKNMMGGAVNKLASVFGW